MGIVEIKKINVGNQVYTQMKDQILSGEWKPGEKIPSENQLMTLFGVSRGTIRQTVQKLAGEGLLYTHHGEGSFVQDNGLDNYFQTNVPLFTIGEEEMAKIFEFRAMFESGVAEVAAAKATDEQIRRLEKNYQVMKKGALSFTQLIHIDLEFHKLISECTQNTLAVQLYNTYEGILAPSILHITKIIGGGNGVKYHGMLLDAIRDHDPQRAKEVMQEHMNENVSRFQEMRCRLQESGRTLASVSSSD